MEQTARLSLLNADVPNGILVTWRFIDASGFTLAQSTVSLTTNKITSVDFRRRSDPLPSNADPSVLIRAEVRAQVEIITPMFRAKAFAEVWRYSTMIPALRAC
jgi:hypothetical protein